MRVLHLTPRQDAGSGIAAYGSKFRTALRAEGTEIIQLSAPADVLQSVTDIRAYSRAAVVESRRGYDMVHAELGGGSLREFYALRAVQRIGSPPTSVTLHDPPHPVWWPLHVHAVRQRRITGAVVRRVTARHAITMQQHLLDRVHAAFCLTHSGVDSVAFEYGPALPLHFLPYPIAGNAVAALPAVETQVLTIGFFGYWYSGKGLTRLADALGQLRAQGVPFKALLWGDISPHAGTRPGQRYRDSVLARLRDETCQGSVEVLGYLDSDQVAMRLHNCDVIVLPYETSRATSTLRSTSASMFDALSAGTPVIATNVKALSEQIEHGVNGLLIPPGSTTALTDALASLHHDPLLRRSLRLGARATADSLEPRDSARAVLAAYGVSDAGVRTSSLFGDSEAPGSPH